jgi:uncharacterized protein YkwD
MKLIKILFICSFTVLMFIVGLGLINGQSYNPIETVSGQIKGSNSSQTLYGPVQPNDDLPTALPTEATAATEIKVSAPPPARTNTPSPASSRTATPTPSPKPIAPAPAPAPATCGGSFNQQFLCLLNQYRASKNLTPLSANSSLSAVAFTHSQWMNTTGTFSHVGIDGSRLGDRCRAAGITCRAENLAMGAKSAQNLLDMWKNSVGHNANLLGTAVFFKR